MQDELRFTRQYMNRPTWRVFNWFVDSYPGLDELVEAVAATVAENNVRRALAEQLREVFDEMHVTLTGVSAPFNAILTDLSREAMEEVDFTRVAQVLLTCRGEGIPVDSIRSRIIPVTPHYPRTTPWGEPQDIKVHAPGIVEYSTACHGGFWLSPERRAEMPEPYRSTETLEGDSWYEEDCEWSIVVLSFPDLFTQQQRERAHVTWAIEYKSRRARGDLDQAA